MIKRETELVLLFPPLFYPHMPYLAFPTISGYLKSRGINCIQKDLNIDFFDSILTSEYVSHAYNYIMKKVKRVFDNKIPENLKLSTHKGMSYVIKNIDKEKTKMQKSCEDNNISVSNIFIELALDIISDSFYPLKITTSSLEMSYSEKSSKDVFESLQDTNQNIFIEYFNSLIPSLLKEIDTKSVAISITSTTQIIPAFTLCNIIRRTDDKINIILGGNVITRLSSFFSKKNILSPFYDYFVIGEGEQKLYSLINDIRLLKKSELKKKYNNKMVTLSKPQNIQNIPTPSFDNLPLKNYFNKETVLPLFTSRRCYWEKCTFCDIPFGYDKTHRKRDVDQIISDIEILMNKYNTRYFKFIDDSISPKVLLEISNELIKRKINIKWEAYVILEKEFQEIDFSRTLYTSGCRWLYFGFESGNENVNTMMNKRHTLQTIGKILKTTSEVGIKNHLWFIIGFPGETHDSINDSVNFLHNNYHYINSIEVNQFSLTKHSSIMKNKIWNQFGIKPIIKKEEDLALLFDYETINGSISQSESKELVIKLRNELFTKYGFSNAVRSSNLFN